MYHLYNSFRDNDDHIEIDTWIRSLLILIRERRFCAKASMTYSKQMKGRHCLKLPALLEYKYSRLLIPKVGC